MGKKIYDPGREKEVLERLKRKNKGPLKEEDLKKIFTTIMKVLPEVLKFKYIGHLNPPPFYEN